MKPLIKGLALNYPVKVFATGFVVLTLLSIPLFWFRFICQTSLSVKMPDDAKDIRIGPSGLVPPEFENDPNVTSRSIVSARMRSQPPLSLGIFDFFIARLPGGHRSNIYFSNGNLMYFDKKSGQIVHLYTEKQTMPDKTTLRKEVQLYVGPEGVSETPDKTLDKSGRIDLLDKETLEFVRRTPEFPGVAGRLPGPETYFGSRSLVTPRELFGYEVWPLALTTYFFENPEEVRVTFGDPSFFFRRSPARVERKYLGMFAASLSRDGTALALAVFDEKGKEIKREDTEAMVYIQDSAGSRERNKPSSKSVFFGRPWSPALTIGKYLAENLHPPILSVASYFTASAFEAASGHRALFFLPNSFIAMKGREHRENFAERFMSALGLILPSIILVIWLAYRVSKDAVVVGLSENARAYWIIGTLAFGLTAYITYRLTRPKITLVSCPNCGKMRRPDMAKCHRCKSDWHVPELIPPAWRVVDK